MPEPYIPCHPKSLPIAQAIDAAKTAIKINPANRPAVELLHMPQEEGMGRTLLSPLHLALLTSKYWGAAGINASVAFLDNPDQATRTLILQHMNAWAPRSNVLFRESTSQTADCRITRTTGQGYYSYLGTDNAHIPAGQNTMNLEGFTSQTPLSEYKRVVRHETGHYLGFPHEHTRAVLVARIDPAKAKAYFLQNDGWDSQTVQEQVLTPLLDSDLTFLSGADQLSIMCYSLPSEITYDGQPIAGGTDIDETDYVLAAKIYPPTGTPPLPPPPPPPGPGGGLSVLFPFSIRRNVQQGGLVLLTAKVAMPAGNYVVGHNAASGEFMPGMAIGGGEILGLIIKYGPVVLELITKYGPGALALIESILKGGGTAALDAVTG